MKKSIILLFTLFFVASAGFYAQNIKRRGFLGVGIENITDSIATIYKLKSTKGVLVNKVIEKSTAESLKIEIGDVILKWNNTEIQDKNQLVQLAIATREGEAVEVIISRKNKEKTLKAKMIGKEYETPDYSEIIYDEVAFRGGFLRTIINKPIGEGTFPTVFLIQGYTCSSMDNLRETNPYAQIIKGLCERGYVVVRTEKVGIGDSYNTPACSETDFEPELESFRASYKKLSDYKFIDQSNIFIFGHSMGGVVAPFIANEPVAKGVMVYGTVCKSWFEYFIDQIRVQNIAMGVDYIENEQIFEASLPLTYKFMVEKQSPIELSATSEYSELLKNMWSWDGNDKIYDRNYKFWQDLQDLNMAAAWKEVKGNVLSIWGEADFVAFSEFDHQMIADVVNRYNTGKATYLAIPRIDHAFTEVENMEMAAEKWTDYDYRSTHFNNAIVIEIDKWMKALIK